MRKMLGGQTMSQLIQVTGTLGNGPENSWFGGKMLCTEVQVLGSTKFLTRGSKMVVLGLGLRRLSNLPKVTQPVNDRTWIGIQGFPIWKPSVFNTCARLPPAGTETPSPHVPVWWAVAH